VKRVKSRALLGSEKANLFYREAYNENWRTAFFSKTEEVESVDVPVNDLREYYVVSRDGRGYYLTRCHHSLSIVRSVKTRMIGVYHHYFIPFRYTNEAFRGSYDGRLYGNFCSNGLREDFTGLEIFSDTEGNIVKLRRYYCGKQYEDLYYGNGSRTREMIAYLMRYYIIKAYGIKSYMKTKSDHPAYSCPDCGYDLREAESGYLFCHNCSWNELDFYDQEIEECIFYDEGGSGTTNGENDSIFPFPDDPQLPDPNTGGNGGGHGNGGGPGIPPSFIMDEKANQQIAPALNILLEDCAGSSIINCISEYKIVFTEKVGMMSIAEMNPIKVIQRDTETQEIIDTTYKYRIDYFLSSPSSGIPIYSLLEELFHCFQHITYGGFSPDWKMNVEVEAKYATFLYMDKHGHFADFPGMDTEKQCFRDYQSEPNEENYARIIDYVRHFAPAYENFNYNPSHRSMLAISVFNCYENQ
jgi:hypothetical protein